MHRMQVVNVVVKESMKIAHGQVASVLSLLGSFWSSLRRGDLFETVKVELEIRNVQVPGLDAERRW